MRGWSRGWLMELPSGQWPCYLAEITEDLGCLGSSLTSLPASVEEASQWARPRASTSWHGSCLASQRAACPRGAREPRDKRIPG
jgi:hypothetical protein